MRVPASRAPVRAIPDATSKGVRAPYPVHPAAEAFPPMDEAEFEALADDIARNGLVEPLTIYDDPVRGTVLLDGLARTAACEQQGVERRYEHYRGDDPVGFVVSKNLHRRHLTAGQKAAIAYELQPFFAQAAKERQREGARKSAARTRDDRGRLQVVADPPPPGPTRAKARDHVGAVVGISGRSVGEYARLASEAPDLARKVKAGSIPLDRAGRLHRDQMAEARRIADARSHMQRTRDLPSVDIRHGDFREVLADLRDIDCIITDPWYHREHLALLGDLAAWADRVLAPDGVLAVMMGQTFLPEVCRLLDGHCPYRWTSCVVMTGGGYNSFPANVHSKWKPVLIYGGGPRLRDDVIRCEASDTAAKALHEYGQDLGAFSTLVERLTLPGQTVCDPLAGSGTTLIAAHALGRHAIGCDVSDESVETMRRRLGLASAQASDDEVAVVSMVTE